MLEKALEGDPLVIVKLGAGGDDYRSIPPHIRRHVILVCLDAATDSRKNVAGFAQLIRVDKVIAESADQREFITRAWWGSSSLLEADPALVAKYGLENHYSIVRRTEVATMTLREILQANSLQRIDALVTDLEGMDFPVLRSLGDSLRGTLLVQSELRFEPFYQGEPPFHEVAAYMADQAFRLIDLKSERWKPVSAIRNRFRDGVATWADCLFLNERPLTETERIKRAVLLFIFGQKALAAHLIETEVPQAAREALLAMVSHRPLLPSLRLHSRLRALKWRIFGSPFPHVS